MCNNSNININIIIILMCNNMCVWNIININDNND